MRSKTKKIISLWSVIFLISTIILANLYWIKLDTRPQPVIDEYVEKTLNLADGMSSHSLVDYPRLFYWATIGPRPPLYQIMAAPFVIFIDRSPDAMLIVNAIFLLILGVTTYKIAELAMDIRAGMLASMIVITYPLTVDLAKIARPHALLPAATALVILIMLLTIKKRNLMMAWILAGAMLFAFSIHAYSLNLLLGPLLIFSFYSIFFQKKPISSSESRLEWAWIRFRDPFVLFGLLPAMLVVFGLILGWIILKWEQLLGLREVAETIFAPMYGFWHYEQTISVYISPFFSVFLIIGSFTTIIVAIKEPHKYVYRVFLLITLFLMFLGAHFSMGAKSWHTFSGSLPVMAALGAFGILDLVRMIERKLDGRFIKKPIAPFVIFVCFCFLSINYLVTGWGIPKNEALLKNFGYKLNCGDEAAFCPKYPISGDWQIKTVLSKILENPKCNQNDCQLVLLSHRPNYYSDEAFTYSMVQFYPEMTLKNTKSFYPERTLKINRIGRGKGGNLNWLMADYCLFITDSSGEPTKEPVKYYGAGGFFEYAVVDYIINSIKIGNSPYRIVFEALLPNGFKVTLAYRTREISLQDSIQIVDSLKMSDSLKDEFRIYIDKEKKDGKIN